MKGIVNSQEKRNNARSQAEHSNFILDPSFEDETLPSDVKDYISRLTEIGRKVIDDYEIELSMRIPNPGFGPTESWIRIRLSKLQKNKNTESESGFESMIRPGFESLFKLHSFFELHFF